MNNSHLPVRLVGSALPLLTLLLSTQAQAEVTPEVGGGILLDFNAGGDELLELSFSDGSEQSITGGQGFAGFLTGGAIFFDEQSHNLETILNVGVKYSTMQQTQNANLDFLRFPLEALAFYRNDDWFFRIGGGAQLLVGASMSGSGALDGVNAHFSPAVGGIGQVDFIYRGWSLGERYTGISLTEETSGQSAASHSIGFQISGCYQFLTKK